MTYKHSKQTQERYAIKKSSKWKTAGSVLVASLIFGSSVVLNDNKVSADETNTESTLSTVSTGETTADLIEESTQTDNASETTETSTDTDTSTSITQRHPIRQQYINKYDRGHDSNQSSTDDSSTFQLQKQVLLKLLQSTTSETSETETNNADENTSTNTSSSSTETTASKQLQF